VGSNTAASVALTGRQQELARFILTGYSKKIADETGLTYGTVKNYMFNLMRRLSVRSRLELVAKLREPGVEAYS
jgi:DNA-binding NarL/FixJ family response regulator